MSNTRRPRKRDEDDGPGEVVLPEVTGAATRIRGRAQQQLSVEVPGSKHPAEGDRCAE